MRRRVAGISVALSLACLAAPLAAQAATTTLPTKTSSVCKDGAVSQIVGRGACSGHGGIDSIATAAAKKARKAVKADAKAIKAKASKDAQKIATAAALAKKADDKAAKADEKAAHDSVGATAQCRDGTFSHAATATVAC
ncbi:MAG: hypothetical protein ACREPM_25910, partial [Gemmatimonadaceae bacterium]